MCTICAQWQMHVFKRTHCYSRQTASAAYMSEDAIKVHSLKIEIRCTKLVMANNIKSTVDPYRND